MKTSLYGTGKPKVPNGQKTHSSAMFPGSGSHFRALGKRGQGAKTLRAAILGLPAAILEPPISCSPDIAMRRLVSETLTDHRKANFAHWSHRYAIALAIPENGSLCEFIVKWCARYARHHCSRGDRLGLLFKISS